VFCVDALRCTFEHDDEWMMTHAAAAALARCEAFLVSLALVELVTPAVVYRPEEGGLNALARLKMLLSVGTS
jgi:hypothetical protein